MARLAWYDDDDAPRLDVPVDEWDGTVPAGTVPPLASLGTGMKRRVDGCRPIPERRLQDDPNDGCVRCSSATYRAGTDQTVAVLSVSDLEGDLVERIISSCRMREPRMEAILVHGSYATGRARPDSDLDLGLFIAGEPSEHYRTWFETRQHHQLLHISARCDLNIDVWEQEGEEPEDWALGLPVELAHAWLWVGDGRLVDLLGERPVLAKPGSPPEIEDLIDAVIKMRRHAAAGDELGARLEAQAAARYAAPTVAALNALEPVTDPRSALDAIAALPVAPPQWASDLVVATGLVARTIDEVVEVTNNLALGVLRLVRELNPHADPQPEIARYLTDGTLERMLQ